MRLFKVFFPTRVVALLLSEVAIVYGSFLASVLLTEDPPKPFLFDEAGLYRIGLATLCVIAGFYFNDLYSQLRVRSKSQLLQQVCFVLGVVFLIQSLLDFLKLADWALPKWTMIVGSLFVLLLQPAWRILYDRAVIRRLASDTVLFVGASPVARMIAERLTENPQFGLTVAGYLEDAPASAGVPADLLLGSIRDLQEVVEAKKPQRIIVAMTEGGTPPVLELLEIRAAGIHVEEAKTAYENVFSRISVKDLDRSHLIFLSDLSPRPKGELSQRIYSFAAALLGLLIVSPLLLLIALAVKFTSPGPVLCRQSSAGRNGASFQLFYFRSTFDHDARVTPVGRWLRRLRLDELPQLLNVLRGEMVIVGPRPERPEFVEALAGQIPYYRQRLLVKPGVTGWAQIKTEGPLEDTLMKLEYDLYYIKNLSITMDLYIMFYTLKVMLLSGNAH
jgi:exopolysaccharide biosynthesis polyprenyl glycosylphosphotransferase